MINVTDFFNLQDIFVNELVGDWWLFTFLALIVVWFLCVSNKIPFEIASIFTVLLIAILYATNNGLIALWVLVILAVGALYYYSLSRPARRG